MAKRPSWLSCFSTPPVHDAAALNPGRTVLPLRSRHAVADKGADGPGPKFVEPRSFRHQGRGNKH